MIQYIDIRKKIRYNKGTEDTQMKAFLPTDFLIRRIHSITTIFNDTGATGARTDRPFSALL